MNAVGVRRPIAPILGSQSKRIGVCTRDKGQQQALFAIVGVVRASCSEMEGMAGSSSLSVCFFLAVADECKKGY